MYVNKQSQVIQEALKDPMFVMDAAQQAANADPILTAHTFNSVRISPYGRRNSTEVEISHRVYKESYTRIGILRALEAAGVANIPPHNKDLLYDLTQGDRAEVGLSIRQLLKEIRNLRK